MCYNIKSHVMYLKFSIVKYSIQPVGLFNILLFSLPVLCAKNISYVFTS